ncbi:MAG: hypothetical protein JEZ07_09080 [Phycisphaerae bacterium]|nr:hypothetical protein [Phycisphaerae bacterium]
MTIELYNGKKCPCPSNCQRHGKCRQCIDFHHGRAQQTYCEHLAGVPYPPENADDKAPVTPDSAIQSGKEIRLLDYAPCAG